MKTFNFERTPFSGSEFMYSGKSSSANACSIARWWQIMKFPMVITSQFILRRWHHVLSSFLWILSVSLLRVLIIKVLNKRPRDSQQQTLLEPRAILQLQDRGLQVRPKPESARKTGFWLWFASRSPTSSQQLGSGPSSMPGYGMSFLTFIRN